jgi:hypothetical protein
MSEAVGPVNLNTYVRFKMKPRGVQLAREYWERFAEFPNSAFPVDQPDTEARQQFHELFRMFGGQHMRHDMDGSPIYDLIIDPMPG